MDFASSADPHVQRQLDRLTALSPGADILGLERITELLHRLGEPQRALPPVLHVAGTNGKGSTCAFLRASIEAAGMRAHVYSSPHLVRFNERIRLSGDLIDDAILAPLLAEVLDAGGDIGASFFEITTAAAFLAFARVPADALILEVGLGGRLDATNVIADPASTAIAQLGIDHQAFLGDTLAQIAAEKAGIAKLGRPLVTMAYPPEIAAIVRAAADVAGAPVYAEGDAWSYAINGNTLHYRDFAGTLETPLPALAGPHQPANFALALASLRHQDRIALPDSAYAAAARNAYWPARMQRMGEGPLTALLPPGTTLWLDGGHNANAADAVSAGIARETGGRPLHIVLGMLDNKDAETMIARFAPLAASFTGVPVPGHGHHPPAALADSAHAHGVASVTTAPDLPTALRQIAAQADPRSRPVVLILGSLYLAGTALAANEELPN